MKRLVLFILVLILLVDFAEERYLGKVKFCLPTPSAKIAVTASHKHPNSGSVQSDFGQEQRVPNWRGIPRCGEARLVSLFVRPNLQIMHNCYLSSSGGIPL